MIYEKINLKQEFNMLENDVVLTTIYLNLEAVMYPTVVMTYTDPNGRVVAVADTREGNSQQEVETTANLAMGVAAPITVETYNIDEGSLNYTFLVFAF